MEKDNKKVLTQNETTGTKEVTAKKTFRPRKNVANDQNENSDKVRTQNRRGPRRNNTRNNRQRVESEYTEKVIDIARVTKVVKGGRRFSFSAFVVIGNKKGVVGYGHGKANEVPDSIKKAIKDAKNNLVTVPLDSKTGTIPHEIPMTKYLASKVMLKPAPKGKGLIASGAVRAVVELAGYTDIVTKTYGSRKKANIVKATVKALKQLRTPEQIAELRDKDVKDFK
ncbi:MULTISPECIES: 30S ribosomal protein S5 [unclassified Mycoplasma]|uniref:30S ribosomal protein S5 n=1 Tax=unclassified Mycoplasma TaxID=2683645 RepID=UPI001F11FBE1|nr:MULTISPECIES: 30S ribosomal protein S5 [unclassified Mycoplasma]MCU4706876.1 30S ribosomal protein S5 [Mycoplasma sp. CSL7503-lung]